jgi:hypothetical protein
VDARGLFNQIIPLVNIVVAQSHPTASITTNANGTATGTLSS